ncbi:helix-turn-helix transcriptional regulator [Xinfangfangia sp. D13-10-4-6]|uniref:helix-turn-helix domain-containing protein n=1 Tax=Pseudogemmobacter hezensis TaxID=2737662 RepID=UPI001552C353|nr:AraC family transcriptional regulator [Pseudogemmobacter hezensis]NPD15526.1 helix-turn-helix transcriptional regulator [Pseudogemmobacter hezensis]
MSFRPNMTSQTTGIQLLAPLAWQALPGVVADVWQVAVSRGGKGSYVAPDPRIVAVLGPDESGMRLAHGRSRRGQPIALAYIPAGLATRSGFRQSGRLTHLDVHLSQDVLQGRLEKAGLSDADPAVPGALLQQPRLFAASPEALLVAQHMAEEIRAKSCSRQALTALLDDLIQRVFAPGAAPLNPGPGGLGPAQMARIERLMHEELHRPLSVAEMAGQLGLSESWFAHAWAQSRGEPPHRSLQKLRIQRAKALLQQGRDSLASIAIDAGFADQAHFTRSFRKLTGETPGTWRRSLARRGAG